MAAPSKPFTPILDSQVDADSPLNVTLLTSIRDSLVHLEEWLGLSYTAAQDHDHDGANSKLVGVGMNLIDSAVASASATLEVTGMDSTYDLYLATLTGFLPATDGALLYLRTGLSSSYASGANDYGWEMISNVLGSAPAVPLVADTTDLAIQLADTTGGANLSNQSDALGDWKIWIYNPASTAQKKVVTFEGHYLDETGTPGQARFIKSGVGRRESTGAIDGIQLLQNIGNIAVGTARLYGVLNASP